MSDSSSEFADSFKEGLLDNVPADNGELCKEPLLLLILLQFPSLSFSTCFLKSVTIPDRDGIAERASFKKIEIINSQNIASFNRKNANLGNIMGNKIRGKNNTFEVVNNAMQMCNFFVFLLDFLLKVMVFFL